MVPSTEGRSTAGPAGATQKRGRRSGADQGRCAGDRRNRRRSPCYLAPIGELEDALTLQPEGGHRWTVVADPDHESVNAMYGGWTVAAMLRAVEAASDHGEATPTSITANFVGRIEPGMELSVSVRALGGSGSVSHWLAEVAPRDGEETLALGCVVMAVDRPSDRHVEVSMPEAPDPDSLEVFHPPGRQGDRVVMRPVSGFPPFGRSDTHSTAWMRVCSHRPVDYQQLAYLADQRAPRSFHWSDGPRPSATITMSVYFHASRMELADVGDDYILGEAFGVKAAWSTSEEHHRLWSRQGSLLASSEQMARYR